MTKINQEEYWVLKGLDDSWKWIARDRNTTLWVYKKEPSKQEYFWDEYMDDCEMIGSALFQFIRWEDENPYNITELIEEYEISLKYQESVELGEQVIRDHIKNQLKDGSEENEVRKDKQWAISELTKIINFSKASARNGFSTEYFYGKESGIKEAIQILDQLDEPETIEQTTLLLESTLKENKRLGELLEEKHEEWLELMDKINNQETLKKPTIPQFVAEFLRGKEEYMLYELLDNDFIYDDYDELAKWLYNNDEDTNKEREFSLVLAQRYGYEVEEEQKLTARDLIEKHIELLKNQEEAVNLKPYYDLLERVKNE